MSILRNRNFAILFGGQMVSVLGTNLFLLALPWYVYLRTGSKTDLAIVGFVQSLSGIAALFAGVYVDRWNKRMTMVGSDVIRSVLALVMAVDVIFDWGIPLLIVLVLLLQLAGVCFGPAESALLPYVVGETDLPAAMGINQSGSATVQLAGQIGGGAMLTFLGAPVLFVANAISFGVSVLSLLWVRADEPARVRRNTSYMQEWKEGFAILGRSRMILLLMVSAMVTNFGFAPFDIALTAWVKGPLHGSAFWLGILGSLFFVGVILGGIGLGWVTKHLPIKRTLLLGLVGAGALFGCIGLWANPYWDSVLLLFGGVCVGTLNGSLGALGVAIVPPAYRGRIFGLMGALGTVATPLGLAIFGGMMVYVSLTIVFLVMGLLSVVSGLSFLLPIPDDTGNLRAALTEDM